MHRKIVEGNRHLLAPRETRGKNQQTREHGFLQHWNETHRR
jgi:hypothetical protein